MLQADASLGQIVDPCFNFRFLIGIPRWDEPLRNFGMTTEEVGKEVCNLK
jgi:hypothetical protein